MNEKYQRHLEVAKKCGMSYDENVLKRAFRNLEKIEKAEARKGNIVGPFFKVSMGDTIDIIFSNELFKLKGSNGGERIDSAIEYVLKAGAHYNTIEDEYRNKYELLARSVGKRSVLFTMPEKIPQTDEEKEALSLFSDPSLLLVTTSFLSLLLVATAFFFISFGCTLLRSVILL